MERAAIQGTGAFYLTGQVTQAGYLTWTLLSPLFIKQGLAWLA